MFGRAYDVDRHMGRMGMDSRQRMSNKAEIGFGKVGTMAIIILLVLMVAAFL
jgi:hypothetical protein